MIPFDTLLIPFDSIVSFPKGMRGGDRGTVWRRTPVGYAAVRVDVSNETGEWISVWNVATDAFRTVFTVRCHSWKRIRVVGAIVYRRLPQ